MRRSCNGFVLVAVLVIVLSAILLATSLLFLAQGRAADAATTVETAQHRLLAWSGTQAVMSRLNDQRDRLLAGEPPILDRQYVLYETGSRLGVVRLLPMPGGTGADAGPALAVAEAGKIDLNTVDAAGLAATGLIDRVAADQIIQFRDQTLRRPFQSEYELLMIPGGVITPEKLYGPIEEIKPRDQAELFESDLAERVQERLAPAEGRLRGLADLVTVYAVEPALQRDGVLKINLNVNWSDDLAEKVRRRFGDDAVNALKALFDQGAKFTSDADIVKTLRTLNVPPENWADILDAFTTEPGDEHFGRLNLNTASAEALMSLPGVTPEQADQLVSMREQLSSDVIDSIVWPVTAQIITPEQFEQLAARLTTRSWTFRVRLAAGNVSADEPEGTLSNPVIFEAVIDCSAPAPRIAYLRDISVLQAAAQIAWQSTANRPPDFEFDQPEPSTADTAEQPSADDDAEADVTNEGEPDESSSEPSRDEPTADENQRETEQSPSAGGLGSGPSSPAAPVRRRIGRWIGGG